MELLNTSLQEGKLICCNPRNQKKPSQVCITVGCASRLICEECSQAHPSDHKSINIQEFIQKTAISIQKNERREDKSRPSEHGIEAEFELAIQHTKNLLKSLKNARTAFETWRTKTKECFESFEESMKELVSKPSKISNKSFSKIYDLITAANVGQTKNFLPDIPAEEWMLILQHGLRFTQDFRDVVDKMMPEIAPKTQYIIVDGHAIKPKLQPFISKYIKIKKRAPNDSSAVQVIELDPIEEEKKAEEEEKVEDLTPKIKAWEEAYGQLQDKVESQDIDIEAIDILIETAKELPIILQSKKFKDLETARSDYLRLDACIQKTRDLKQTLLDDAKTFKGERTCRQPQHPKLFKKISNNAHKTKLEQRHEEKPTRDDFTWSRNDIKRYGFRKLWEEYQESFKAEEQFIKDSEKEMQLEPSKEFKAIKARFISHVELVFQQENFKEDMAEFFKAWEMYQELENFVLYLKSLKKGVNLYVMNKGDDIYLSKFPDLQDAKNLRERIHESRVIFPRELIAQLEDQINLAAGWQLFLGNQHLDPITFEKFIKNAKDLKLNFEELEEAQKMFISYIAMKVEEDRADIIESDEDEEEELGMLSDTDIIPH